MLRAILDFRGFNVGCMAVAHERRQDKREILIEKALEAIAELGPSGVHPATLTEELDYSKALVNYHFGDREGLIAEAMALGYERYVDELWRAADLGGESAVDRLMAWISRQVDWSIENPGLAAALNFPRFAAGLTEEESAEEIERMGRAGYRNFLNLSGLVVAARLELTGTSDGPEVARAISGVVGFLTLGMSVWYAGEHLPSRTIEGRPTVEDAKAYVRSVLIGMLSR